MDVVLIGEIPAALMFIGVIGWALLGFMANEVLVALQVLTIAMLFIFPEIVTWLPPVIY